MIFQSNALLRDEAEARREAPASPSDGRRNPRKSARPRTRETHHAEHLNAPLNRLATIPTLLLAWINSGVYFIERDGLVKVGQTYNLQKRLRAFGRKGAVRLLAIGAAKWRREAELRIHDAFRPLHVGHEWFRPSPELMDLIQEVQRTGHIPANLDGHLGYFNHPPRLRNGDCKPKPRKLHWTHRRSLDRARTTLLVAALIERRTRRVVTSSATHGVPTDLPTAEVATHV